MFIKSKATAGKASASQMLLSFKTLVTYKKTFLASCRTAVSVMKQLWSDITRKMFDVRC